MDSKKHQEKYILIGKSISMARKSRGYSQQELAERIGVSKSYISKIEAPNCSKSFSLEVLLDIAEALELPVTTFLKDIGKDRNNG
jgi:transcriptional regulator with XRE-family HTH domain